MVMGKVVIVDKMDADADHPTEHSLSLGPSPMPAIGRVRIYHVSNGITEVTFTFDSI